MSVSDNPDTQTPLEPAPLIRPSQPVSTKPSRSTEFSASLLFNVIIPIALIVAGLTVVKVLGVATAPPRDGDDESRAGRLQALTAVRVEKIASLESTGQQLQLVVDGTVVPFREARVASEIAGRIISKEAVCEAGSVVTEGQLLMKIDPTDYDLEVDRLTRQKEQAYQSILELDQEKANTARVIKIALDDVELQQKEVQRQESMPKGFASRGDIDRAKRSLIQAQQTMLASENQLDLLDKRRVRLEASEKLAATQLKAAELNLERSEIRAPIDGVIVSEDADVNTFVNRGSVLLTIEDTSKVEVATNLRMDQLYWVLDQKHDTSHSTQAGYTLPDTEAIIQFDLPGRDDVTYRWNGRLLSYDGVGLDPQTRTVPVRLLVDDPKTFLLPTSDDPIGKPQTSTAPTALLRGMYVQVKLKIKPLTPLVVIPGTALQPGNRVWQFVPDESALDKPAADDKDVSENTDNAPVTTAQENSQDDSGDQPNATEPKPSESVKSKAKESNAPKFNADDWTPGRVLVQRNVFPVDALIYSDGNKPKSNSQFESTLSGERQFWVCETKGESFGKGAYVVTSPLSGVDAGGLTARAELPANDDSTTKTDTPKAQPKQAAPDQPPDQSSDQPSDQPSDQSSAESGRGTGDAA